MRYYGCPMCGSVYEEAEWNQRTRGHCGPRITELSEDSGDTAYFVCSNRDCNQHIRGRDLIKYGPNRQHSNERTLLLEQFDTMKNCQNCINVRGDKRHCKFRDHRPYECWTNPGNFVHWVNDKIVNPRQLHNLTDDELREVIEKMGGVAVEKDA